MLSILNYNYRTDHFSTALFSAVVLHIILAVLLPDIPKLSLAGFDRDSSLTVFFSETEEEEKFDQSLNQQLPLPANIETLADPSLGSTSIEKGEDAIVSEEATPSEASSDQAQDSTSVGPGANGESEPSIRFDYATVRLFARKEAIRYADLHAQKVDKFARTFNRFQNFRRRSRTESHKNRLGDLYARSNSSAGDICFKQQRESAGNDYATNTVYFFRCDKKPQGLELEINKKAKG